MFNFFSVCIKILIISNLLSSCTEIVSKKQKAPVSAGGLALSSENATFAVSFSWFTRVVEAEFETVLINFTDPNTKEPLTMTALLTFDPQMPSMGHGTYKKKQTFQLSKDSTSAIVENVFFTMGGDWTIEVKATTGDGKVDSAFVDLFVNFEEEEEIIYDDAHAEETTEDSVDDTAADDAAAGADTGVE